MTEQLAPPTGGGSIPTPSLHIKVIADKIADNEVRVHHYLHRARVGRRLSYGIFIGTELEGVITYAYPMICSKICGVPSDEMLEFGRMFLRHNIPNMASRSISFTLKRVRADWIKKYPSAKEPKLIITWADTVVHRGTIYKASNFWYFRRTKPRARGPNRNNAFVGGREMRADHWHPKDCYLYPLDKSVVLVHSADRR